MPLLRLQTKSAHVDDGVSLSAPDSEPLTFRAPRTAESMNRPKQIFRPGASPFVPTVNDAEQRDIWASPEPEIFVADAHSQSENSLTSSSATLRGILKFTANFRPRNTGSERRRVRFGDERLSTGRPTRVPSTPRHLPTFSLGAEAGYVWVKIEDTSTDLLTGTEGVEQACQLGTKSTSEDVFFGAAKPEPTLPSLSTGKRSEHSLRACTHAPMKPSSKREQENGSLFARKKQNHPSRPAEQTLHRQLRAFFRLHRTSHRCSGYSSRLVSVLYGPKRHSHRRGRRCKTHTVKRVMRDVHRRRRASCTSQTFFVKVLEVRLGSASALRVPCREAFQRFVRSVRRCKRVQTPERFPTLATAHVPSIVVTAPSVPEIFVTAVDEGASGPFQEVAPIYARCSARPRSDRALRELLKHTWEMMWEFEPLLCLPSSQLLRSLRALAHHLLQQSSLLKENSVGLQPWEEMTFKRLRDLLKDVVGLTAIVKLNPSEVEFETWQNARTVSLRRLNSIKRLCHRTLGLPSAPAARTPDLLSPATPKHS